MTTERNVLKVLNEELDKMTFSPGTLGLLLGREMDPEHQNRFAEAAMVFFVTYALYGPYYDRGSDLLFFQCLEMKNVPLFRRIYEHMASVTPPRHNIYDE